MKKVSVLIPVYNHELYLNRFLKSLDDQDYPNIEYIAVDDGSTDKSLDILREYEKNNRNFKVIHQENKGVTGSKRTALENAQGDYIAVIESDDYISPNYIKTLVNQMEKTDTNICNPRYAVSLEGKLISKLKFYSAKRPDKGFDLKKEKEALLMVNVTQCKLYKRDYYHLTDKYFRINEDLCMTYYNSALAERISFSNDAIYHYLPNRNGLVSKELSGYGVNKIKNFVLPLDELKKNFEKANLYDYYKEEVEAIFIKNYMEHISDIIFRVKKSFEKEEMIEILLSILHHYFPNWKDNKYYQEYLKNIELTDIFRVLTFNIYNRFQLLKEYDSSVENLLEKYDEKVKKYELNHK